MHDKFKILIAVLLLTAYGVSASEDEEDWFELTDSDIQNVDFNNCFNDTFSSTHVGSNNRSNYSKNITINVNNSSRSRKRKKTTDKDYLYDNDKTTDKSSVVKLAAMVEEQNEVHNQKMNTLESKIVSHYKAHNKRINKSERFAEQCVINLENQIIAEQKLLHENMVIMQNNVASYKQQYDHGTAILVRMIQFLDDSNVDQNKKIKEFEQIVHSQAQVIKDQAEAIKNLESRMPDQHD